MKKIIDPKYAVVVAGGKGLRMGQDLPKQFIEVKGKPILMHTLLRFHEADPNIQIILVLPVAHQAFWQTLCAQYAFGLPHQVINGGDTRFQSVRNGLEAIVLREGLVAIHDGVRPFVSVEVIRRSFELANEKGTALAVVPLKDSIREITETGNMARDRTRYRIVQTPQTFRLSLIKEAFRAEERSEFTDDATVAEFAGFPIHLLDGNYENIKITTPEDLVIAERLAV